MTSSETEVRALVREEVRLLIVERNADLMALISEIVDTESRNETLDRVAVAISKASKAFERINREDRFRSRSLTWRAKRLLRKILLRGRSVS